MGLFDLPDHPVVRNLMATGTPDGIEPPVPHCPLCGAECDLIYLTPGREIVGCDVCIDEKDAEDIEECFSEVS